MTGIEALNAICAECQQDKGKIQVACPWRSISGDYCEEYETIKRCIDRLAELEDKIEDGTLKEFPCKVGDKVCKFNARSNGDIWVLEAKCLKIDINKKGTLFTFSTLVSRYLEEDFFADINGEFIETDKYYVCDREEAEKKLKELKGEKE